ncbi:MAG TPA: alpha/beta fold hydrolase [Candidatus Anaerofilum excrementigallinarum]|nr:alpha/beta fold hydrolase [Candidatus Anaerofilum excrementigallinarum]
MKKWHFAIKVLAAGILCLLLAGCQAAADLTPEQEEQLKQQASDVFSQLQQGEYQQVADQFNTTMASSLDAAQLQTAWEQTIQPLGEYAGFVSSEITQSSAGTTVILEESYEKQGLELRVTFDKEQKISGLWMTYTDAASTVQTPPEGVVEEEISFAADKKFPISGVLALPENPEGKIPVVVLVQGSGQSDRDETIYANKPFRDIAWGLAQQGIATLRYDKRFYTYSEEGQKMASDITVQQEITDDALAALALVQQDERFDASFLLGHSQGGMLMPAIALENGQLTGGISLAGSLRPLWEISYDQNLAAAEAARDTVTEEEYNQIQNQMKQVEQQVEQLRQLDTLDLADDDLLLGLPVKYWRSLQQMDAMEAVEQLDIPLLILQGDADFQVYPDKDYTLWQQTLQSRDNAEFHLYSGLNHLFMPTQGKQDVSEYAVQSQVDSQVITDIAAFVQQYAN